MIIDAREIEELVLTCLQQLRSDLDLPPLDSPSGDTSIFGGISDLDSMALVHLIVDLESCLQTKYGLNWILADERALSRNHSPFRTIATLTEFIRETVPSS